MDPKEKIIDTLRKEAEDAKSCFTQFSFQGLLFLNAALGVIFGIVDTNIFTAFSCLPAIIILQVLCRIGIYKYGAANRAYGLQAYIESLNNCVAKNGVRQRCSREEIDALNLITENGNFEQLFRAWRIIQPTIFVRIYHTPQLKSMRFVREIRYYFLCSRSRLFNLALFVLSIVRFVLDKNLFRRKKYKSVSLSRKIKQFEASRKPKFKEYFSLQNEAARRIRSYSHSRGNAKNYPWFMLSEITNNRYYPGTYLKQMLSVLIVLQYLYLGPMVYACIRIIEQSKIDFMQLSFYILSTLLLFDIIFETSKTYNRRREILEKEIHSIHASSIIWNIVAIGHYRGILAASHNAENSKADNVLSFEKAYLDYIHNYAYEASNNIYEIDLWLQADMIP
jgi:hypothetical protein